MSADDGTTLTTSTGAKNENAERAAAVAKAKYITSSERITTSVSGGGIIYGKRPARVEAKLASLNTKG